MRKKRKDSYFKTKKFRGMKYSRFRGTDRIAATLKCSQNTFFSSNAKLKCRFSTKTPWKKTFENSSVKIKCYKNRFFPWNLANYKYFFRSKLFIFWMKGKTANNPNQMSHEKTCSKTGISILHRAIYISVFMHKSKLFKSWDL